MPNKVGEESKVTVVTGPFRTDRPRPGATLLVGASQDMYQASTKYVGLFLSVMHY